MDQLDKIFQALGTPTEEEWPVSSRFVAELAYTRYMTFQNPQNHSKLPDYLKFEKRPKQPLRFLFTAASIEALDWLGRTLAFDPNKRITAEEVRYMRLKAYVLRLI